MSSVTKEQEALNFIEENKVFFLIEFFVMSCHKKNKEDVKRLHESFLLALKCPVHFDKIIKDLFKKHPDLCDQIIKIKNDKNLKKDIPYFNQYYKNKIQDSGNDIIEIKDAHIKLLDGIDKLKEEADNLISAGFKEVGEKIKEFIQELTDNVNTGYQKISPLSKQTGKDFLDLLDLHIKNVALMEQRLALFQNFLPAWKILDELSKKAENLKSRGFKKDGDEIQAGLNEIKTVLLWTLNKPDQEFNLDEFSKKINDVIKRIMPAAQNCRGGIRQELTFMLAAFLDVISLGLARIIPTSKFKLETDTGKKLTDFQLKFTKTMQHFGLFSKSKEEDTSSLSEKEEIFDEKSNSTADDTRYSDSDSDSEDIESDSEMESSSHSLN